MGLGNTEVPFKNESETFTTRDSAAGFIMLPISVITLIVALAGNFFLLYYYREKRRRRKTVLNILAVALAWQNVLGCVTAIPVHICKLVVDLISVSSWFDYNEFICLLRYLFTMTSVDVSLVTLTIFVAYQANKIADSRATRVARITTHNVGRVKWGVVIATVVPNIVIFTSLFYIRYASNKPMCVKWGTDANAHGVEIVEGVKKTLIAVPCVTIMIRSVTNLKHCLKLRNKNNRMSGVIRKVNFMYVYSAAYLVFWLPFGVLFFTHQLFPPDFYGVLHNIGYTVSYGYLATVPIVTILTDKRCKKKLFKHLPHLSQSGDVKNDVNNTSYVTNNAPAIVGLSGVRL